MTCREFKHAAASLTLWELRTDNGKLLDHAEECSKCGAWMDRQQMLAVSMQALQAQTAGREAGPQVERALLRMFRQEPFNTRQSAAAFRSAPVAFRLSRFFEMGAYAAAAAAVAIALFLGVRLLEQRSAMVRSQNQASPAAPAAQAPHAASMMPAKVTPEAPGPHAVAVRGARAVHPAALSARSKPADGAAAAPTSEDPDYVALMFCDPLSCSSDAQVVRMELPPAAGSSDHDAPLVADVVVGDDGVVRAMRIVN